MMTRECPFTFCTFSFDPIHVPAPPLSMGGGVAQKMVPQHMIENPFFVGPCPASLLYIPFTAHDPMPPDTKRVLGEQYRSYAEQLPRLIQLQNNREEWAKHRAAHSGWQPDSQSLRGPHRAGREPASGTEEENDWQLGGREDDESGHISPEPNQPVHPQTRGPKVGGNAMSISEIQGMLNGANVALTEGMGVLHQVKDSLTDSLGPIGTAESLVAGALEDAQSPTLRDSLGLDNKAEADVRQALTLLESAIGALAESHRLNEHYIGLLNE